MNCPDCNEILIKTTSIEEQILPFKQQDSIFPVEIIVIETEIYKCYCGAIIKIPKSRRYR